MANCLRPVSLALFLLASGCANELVSNAACEDHPLHEVLMAEPDQRMRVILTLHHDDTLTVAEAQRRVLDSLDGTTFEIVRQPENFPVLALHVAENAFCRLTDNNLVLNIEEDRPEPPTGIDTASTGS